MQYFRWNVKMQWAPATCVSNIWHVWVNFFSVSNLAAFLHNLWTIFSLLKVSSIHLRLPSLFRKFSLTFLQFANMFTQCHGAHLESYLLVYPVELVLVQRLKPLKPLVTIKTGTFCCLCRRFELEEGCLVPTDELLLLVIGKLSAAFSLIFPAEAWAVEQIWWVEQTEHFESGL